MQTNMKILISRDQIADGVARIGQQITRDFAGETVILVGGYANVCVESTARDAFFNDYNVVLPRDLICWLPQDTPMAEATFMSVAIYFGFVCAAADVLECWADRRAETVPA